MMLSETDKSWVRANAQYLAKKLSLEKNVLVYFSDFIELGSGMLSRFDSKKHRQMVDALDESGVSEDGFTIWCGCQIEDNINPDYVVTIGMSDVFPDADSVVCELDRNSALATVLSSIMHELRHAEQYEAGKDTSNRPDDM